LSLALAAALLLAPSLILGEQYSHSSAQNFTWAAQFSEQFRAGILYPRWLPHSFEGLGSPAFFFYPPLFFWIDGLVSIVTFDALPLPHRLSVTAALILWASGLSMFAWLKGETSSRRALIGALIYMAAPYHLLDHFMRGALAEFTAYATLPLVMQALRCIASRHRFGGVFLAVSYACLLFSHLPAALLASVTLLPAYVLWRVRRPEVLLGSMLGIGLAAIYLVPALMLQDWIAVKILWSSFYQIDVWFLLTPQRWPILYVMLVIALLSAAYALLAAMIGLQTRKLGFWIAVVAACLLLMSGLVPWFWHLPYLAKVQFPWRLMPIIEFALVTALCTVPITTPRRGLRIAILITLVPAVILIMSDVVARIMFTYEHPQLVERDAKEYEPHGFPASATENIADLGLEHVAGVPPISCTPTAQRCTDVPGEFGTLRIEIDSDAPTEIVLRRFYYPFWRLDPALPVFATDPLRLVSFVVPAGRNTYNLRRVAVPAEKAGWAISALSFALLMTWLAVQRYRRRM